MIPTDDRESKPKARNDATMRTDSMWCFMCGVSCVVRVTEGRSLPQAGHCSCSSNPSCEACSAS